jgi:hypothetical protein
MTSLTLSLLVGICARSHHLSKDDEDVFAISPVIGYVMAACGLICCVVPFLPGAGGDISHTRFFWYFSPFWAGAFTASAYFFRYQVIVKDQSLTFGAFFRRTVPFSEIIDWDVVKGSKASELWVYQRSGQRLKFSGMLSDFDELTGMVNSHMADPPRGHPDSPEKLQDRQLRAQNTRRADRLTYAGLAFIGVVIFVLWRMRLLN